MLKRCRPSVTPSRRLSSKLKTLQLVDNTACIIPYSSDVPTNETCQRVVDCIPHSVRFFWRGDVLVGPFDGPLALGHMYKDVEEAAEAAVEEVLKKAYESQGIERGHAEYGPFSFQEELSSMFLLNSIKATASGS